MFLFMFDEGCLLRIEDRKGRVGSGYQKLYVVMYVLPFENMKLEPLSMSNATSRQISGFDFCLGEACLLFSFRSSLLYLTLIN